MPAKFVIHTVGPVWHGGDNGENAQLANCYRRSLEVAQENGVGSIAFPAISTGIYGYPIEDAAGIAVDTVRTYLQENKPAINVVFCCFSHSDLAVYNKELGRGA